MYGWPVVSRIQRGGEAHRGRADDRNQRDEESHPGEEEACGTPAMR